MSVPTETERQAASDKLNKIEDETGVNADYLACHATCQPTDDYLSRQGLSDDQIAIVKDASKTIQAD